MNKTDEIKQLELKLMADPHLFQEKIKVFSDKQQEYLIQNYETLDYELLATAIILRQKSSDLT